MGHMRELFLDGERQLRVNEVRLSRCEPILKRVGVLDPAHPGGSVAKSLRQRVVRDLGVRNEQVNHRVVGVADPRNGRRRGCRAVESVAHGSYLLVVVCCRVGAGGRLVKEPAVDWRQRVIGSGRRAS